LDKRDSKIGHVQTTSAKEWRPTKLGVRGANSYQIWGIRYEEIATGEIAWQITIHPKGHGYWVARGQFFSVSMDLFHNFTNTTLVQVHGTISSLDSEEKESVLAAIDRWQRPKQAAAKR
jgi:hypothetical protein